MPLPGYWKSAIQQIGNLRYGESWRDLFGNDIGLL
jgi:hypothetical protein